METNFYLDKSAKKLDRKLQARIFLFVSFESKRFKIYTGQKILKDEWDAEKQQAKQETTGADELNNLLNSLADEVKSVYRRAKTLRVPVSVEYLKDNLSFVRKKELSFFDVFDKFVNEQRVLNGWSENTLKNFGTFKENLQKFSKAFKYHLEFNSLNSNFLQKFIQWHIDKKAFNTHTLKNIKLLKWFLAWATQKKLNTNLDFQTWKPKLPVPSEWDNIIFLTIDELATVYNLQDLTDSLSRVRDVFCFTCFSGLRFSDISQLKKSDIRNGNIHITLEKTKKALKIPLNSYAKEILKKYKDSPDAKALPVISGQKYNEYLKDLAQKAKLNEPSTYINYIGNERIETNNPKCEVISSHTGRKTFICCAVFFDIPIEVVIEYTGQSIDIVRRYYQIQDKQKEREMRKFNKLRIA